MSGKLFATLSLMMTARKTFEWSFRRRRESRVGERCLKLMQAKSLATTLSGKLSRRFVVYVAEVSPIFVALITTEFSIGKVNIFDALLQSLILSPLPLVSLLPLLSLLPLPCDTVSQIPFVCCELVTNHKVYARGSRIKQTYVTYIQYIYVCMCVFILYMCACVWGIELPLFSLMNANFIAWNIFEILAKCTIFCPHKFFCCSSKWGEIYAHTIKNV